MSFPSAVGSTPYLPMPTADATATTLPYAGYPPAAPAGSDGPALNAEWLGEGYIPQGQGYDEANGQLLSTYNNGESVRLDVQGSANGSRVTDVVLGGHGDFDPPSKGGGVATDGEFVYVADTDEVYVYRREDILDAAAAATVSAHDVIELPDGHNASFLNIRGGRLYVGEFTATVDAVQGAVDARVEGLGERVSDFFEAINPLDGDLGDYLRDQFDALNPVDIDIDLDRPELLVYDIADHDGQPTGTFDADASVERHTIPFDAQGVAITDTGFLFTRSYGSTAFDVGGIRIQSPRELVFQPFDGGEARTVAEIDYYAEGVNIVGGEVWITYESNAPEYAGKYEENTGSPPDNEHIQRFPLDSLDITRDELGA